jgi:hypothetical protein
MEALGGRGVVNNLKQLTNSMAAKLESSTMLIPNPIMGHGQVQTVGITEVT